MASTDLQFSTDLRNNRSGQIQTTCGSSAVLKLFSGALPANPAAADPSGELCSISLPATFLNSSNGVATKAGTWSGTGTGAGNAACFRIYNGASCKIQGGVSDTNGSAVLKLDNVNIAVGQAISINSCTFTEPQA